MFHLPVALFHLVICSSFMLDDSLLNKYSTLCHHPRTIYNKYTQEPVIVNCGSCPACLLRKSSIRTLQLSNYARNFRFVYFVTLTYADEFLPTMAVECIGCDNGDICDANVSVPLSRLSYSDPDSYTFGFYSVPRSSYVRLSDSKINRTFKDDEFFFSSSFLPKDILTILRKVKYLVPGRIPYANRRDLDLFLKRLRYYCNNEKIRYYAVSEYGPRTFRPHWHLLLFTNSERLSESIYGHISKAWCYGRTDASLSRGGCANYVAGYVNSVVCLPEFYQSYSPHIRPKSYHSIGLSETDLYPAHVSVGNEEIADFVLNGISVPDNGNFVMLKPAWSYILHLYPRFSSAFRSDSSCLYELLHSAFTAPERVIHFGFADIGCDPFNIESDVSLKSFCINYLNYLKHYGQRIRTKIPVFAPDFPYHDWLIATESHVFAHIDFDDESSLGCLYRFFLRIRHFSRVYGLVFSCGCRKPYASVLSLTDSLRILSRRIVKFWSDYDYLRLKDYYSTLELADDSSLTDLLYRHYSCDCRRLARTKEDIPLDSSPLHVRLRSLSRLKIRERVKHKEVNDSLGIFL